MVKEKKHLLMVQLMMATLRKARKMEQVNSLEQMVVNTQAIGPTTSSMEEVLSFGPTAIDSKDNGKKVKCME